MFKNVDSFTRVQSTILTLRGQLKCTLSKETSGTISQKCIDLGMVMQAVVLQEESMCTVATNLSIVTALQQTNRKLTSNG